MRILFVGDVVGRSGRTAIAEHLPGMIRDWALDLVVVNGENAAGGFGITEAIYQEFIDAGADAVTLGNHSWDQRLALIPGMVTERDRIGTGVDEFLVDRFGDPKTAGGVFAIDHDEIERPVADHAR